MNCTSLKLNQASCPQLQGRQISMKPTFSQVLVMIMITTIVSAGHIQGSPISTLDWFHRDRAPSETMPSEGTFLIQIHVHLSNLHSQFMLQLQLFHNIFILKSD
jgi:hypothetical protein